MFGLPWYFWTLLLLIVIIFRLTIRRGRASLARLRPEVRELTDKEREALRNSPFRDEMPTERGIVDGKTTDHDNDHSSQQS